MFYTKKQKFKADALTFDLNHKMAAASLLTTADQIKLCPGKQCGNAAVLLLLFRDKKCHTNCRRLSRLPRPAGKTRKPTKANNNNNNKQTTKIRRSRTDNALLHTAFAHSFIHSLIPPHPFGHRRATGRKRTADGHKCGWALFLE